MVKMLWSRRHTFKPASHELPTQISWHWDPESYDTGLPHGLVGGPSVWRPPRTLLWGWGTIRIFLAPGRVLPVSTQATDPLSPLETGYCFVDEIRPWWRGIGGGPDPSSTHTDTF